VSLVVELFYDYDFFTTKGTKVSQGAQLPEKKLFEEKLRISIERAKNRLENQNTK
jgi:hypothetical protein